MSPSGDKTPPITLRPAIMLGVVKGNPARRLYERLGFRVVEEQDKKYVMRWQPER